YSGAAARCHHRAEAIFVVVRNSDAADDGLRIGQLGLAIARKIYAHLMSESGQCTRQGSDHIGQAASFGKGNTLGCRESDMHGEEASSARTQYAPHTL